MYTCITTKDRREVQCVNIVERPGVFEVKDTFQKEKINECIETILDQSSYRLTPRTNTLDLPS